MGSALASAAELDCKVIVVDNDSSDGSAEAIKSQFPNVLVIRNNRNAGFAVACNQALAIGASTLVLLLNSDAELNPAALRELIRVMETNPRCGAAGCGIIDSRGRTATNTWNFLNPFNQAADLLGLSSVFSMPPFARTRRQAIDAGSIDCTVDWIDGACLMLRRAALQDIGTLDEQFFMYSEDEDLCYRLRQRRWSICYTGRTEIAHRGGASAGRERFTNLCRFYESQFRFIAKHQGVRATSYYRVAMRVALALKRIKWVLLLRQDKIAEIDERIAALRSATQSTGSRERVSRGGPGVDRTAAGR